MTDVDPSIGQSPGGQSPAIQSVETAHASLLEFQGALHAHTPRVWVTPLILAINVAVFLIMAASGVGPLSPTSEGLLRWGADFGPYVTGGQPWRLLTNTFVHIGAIHLIMNMIGLWQIGLLVERLLGNAGFSVTYLLAGLCGSLLSTIVHPFTISAGASGAIFGIYGALIAYILRHRGSVPATVLSALQKTAVTFLAFNLILGFRIKGIDMAAHMGGLLGGAVAGLAVASPLRHRSPRPGIVAGRTGVAGLALVALVVLCLPRATDLALEVNVLKTVEQQAISTYNDAVAKTARHELTGEELGRVIEGQVLPPWRAFERRFSARGRVAPNQEALADQLALYLTAREEAWTAISRGLATHNQAAVDAANEALRRRLASLTILRTEDQPDVGQTSGGRTDGSRTPTSP